MCYSEPSEILLEAYMHFDIEDAIQQAKQYIYQ